MHLLLDAASVPDKNRQKDGNDEEVEHHNAQRSERAEGRKGLERRGRAEGKGKHVRQRRDRDGRAGVGQGLDDPLVGGLLDVGLIDGVAEDEHVIDADSNEEEGHELVHASGPSTAQVHEAEAGCVGNSNAEQANQRHHAAAVRRAEVAEEETGVEAHENDRGGDKREVVIDVLDEGFAESLSREEVEVGVLVSGHPASVLLEEVQLPAHEEAVFEGGVARLGNNVRVDNGLGSSQVVGAHWLAVDRREADQVLLNRRRRGLSAEGREEQDVLCVRVDGGVALSGLDLADHLRFGVVRLKVVEASGDGVGDHVADFALQFVEKVEGLRRAHALLYLTTNQR